MEDLNKVFGLSKIPTADDMIKSHNDFELRLSYMKSIQEKLDKSFERYKKRVNASK